MKPLSIISAFMLSISASNAFAVGEYNITFGSCAKQSHPQNIWQTISKEKSDMFLFLGDNVYHDTADKAKIQQAYDTLGNNKNYQDFIKTTPVFATWDDHDYGEPDGGKNFNGKEASKAIFLDFFNVDKSSPAYEDNRGIHTVRYVGENKDVQIIMIDTRWYRDEIEWSTEEKSSRQAKSIGPFSPTTDKTKTMLGDDQWKWLEYQLQQPAKVRILASSIQLIPEFTGWESWANYPHERSRMLDLLNKYNKNNLIVVSGDVHRGEFSKLTTIKNKQLWEISSSGLDAKVYPASANMHRVGDAVISLNYGVINVKVTETGVAAVASLKDQSGKVKAQYKVL